jgi:hypothetical protein
MAEQDVSDLLRQTPFSFIGTIQSLGASLMPELPVDERTAIVRVDHVLQAPPAFTDLEGQSITMQLAPDLDPPQVGESAAFFTHGLAFGQQIAVREVGHVPVEAVEPEVTAAMAAGEPQSFSALQREVDAERLREHASEADAVVVGRVVGLEDAVRPVISEHDPDWWRATIEVDHVESGDVERGPIAVLYANSLDVQWRRAPKPKASQEGLWLLHATEGELSEAAPFRIIHPEDFQPAQQLETIRRSEGGTP